MKRMNVEIKVRVKGLDRVRKIVKGLDAKHIGNFRQKDTYFNVRKDRLKLREIKGRRKAQLIYYERKNVSTPKKSRLMIVDTPDSQGLKEILRKTFGVWRIVDKFREVYLHKGTRIHLDTVKGLGTFVEFERPTVDKHDSVKESRRILRSLIEKLGLDRKDLLKGSYSDMVS